MRLVKRAVYIDGIKVVYFQAGKGKTLLFLHGGRTRALTYKSSLELLSQKYNVIAPDIPGFGDSGTPPNNWTFVNFAQLFDKFIKKLNLQNIAVVGYSFGGGIAFNLAVINRNSSHLILVDSAGQGIAEKSEAIKAIRRVYFYIVRPKLFVVVAILIRDYLYYFYKNFFHLHDIEKIRQKSLAMRYDNLDRIKIPTLILWAKNDVVFPIEIANRFKNEVKGSRIEILDGNHEWILHTPQLFAARVKLFIDGFS